VQESGLLQLTHKYMSLTSDNTVPPSIT